MIKSDHSPVNVVRKGIDVTFPHVIFTNFCGVLNYGVSTRFPVFALPKNA